MLINIHIQCDELAPCCNNCRRRKIICAFETQWPSEPANEGRKNLISDQQSVLGTGCSCTPELPHRCGLTWGRYMPITTLMAASVMYGKVSSTAEQLFAPWGLELIYHYASVTSDTLVDYETSLPVWKLVVPHEAQSHIFLMRSILAISALHLSHLKKNSRDERLSLMTKGLTLHHSALVHFRQTVTEVTATNSSAVLTFSHLVVFTVFASAFSPTATLATENALVRMLAIFDLLRATMKTLRPVWHWLESSNAEFLLHHGPHTTETEHLPPDLTQTLDNIRTSLDIEIGDANGTRRICLSALAQLEDSFVLAQTRRTDWCIALRFPMIFAEEFMCLLQLRDSWALIILAHYCVLLHEAPHRWWAEGWSIRVIIEIKQILDPSYHCLIALPLRTAGLAK
jgi:hypothetical protein